MVACDLGLTDCLLRLAQMRLCQTAEEQMAREKHVTIRYAPFDRHQAEQTATIRTGAHA